MTNSLFAYFVYMPRVTFNIKTRFKTFR